MSHKCPKCGAEVADHVKFCPECGTAQKIRKSNSQTASEQSNQKQKKSAPKISGQNILYLVAILSLMIVGFYGYHLLSPVKNIDPHSNLPASGKTAPGPAFDEQHYQHLQENLKNNPSGLQENVDLANFLFDNQRFSEALEFYLQAIQIDPQQPDVLVDAGVCYFNLEKLIDSRTYFERALKINPDHVNALYNLGVVAARLGEMPQVLQYWERLIRVAPESEQARAARQMMDQVKASEP